VGHFDRPLKVETLPTNHCWVAKKLEGLPFHVVSGVFSGRPFGSTAILVRSVFTNRVSVVDAHNSRITAVHMCNSGQANMLICSVYMPWNDRSSRQLEEYEATLGCLQATIDSYNGCSVVLGGDWNVAKHSNYPAESFVSQFCLDNNLQWLDHLKESVNFTYHCEANNHFSLVIILCVHLIWLMILIRCVF